MPGLSHLFCLHHCIAKTKSTGNLIDWKFPGCNSNASHDVGQVIRPPIFRKKMTFILHQFMIQEVYTSQDLKGICAHTSITSLGRMIIILSIMLLPGMSMPISGQSDTINQVDKQGLKQGYWEKQFPNGKMMYQGYFKDGKPVGKLQRFYESGSLKVLMQFKPGTDYAYSTFFYEDGERAGEGWYYQNQKDSTWTYYSFYTGAVTSREEYNKGVKHGWERQYYANGQVSEEILWENNMKHGPWKQYFEDGTVKLEASHAYNMVNGLYKFYWPNGNLYILGNFSDNKRHGTWSFFTDDGQKKTEIVYHFGKAENEDEIIEQDQEFFKMVEENMGKFEDPTIEDVMPRGY